jgi:hypothetical protein
VHSTWQAATIRTWQNSLQAGPKIEKLISEPRMKRGALFVVLRVLPPADHGDADLVVVDARASARLRLGVPPLQRSQGTKQHEQ